MPWRAAKACFEHQVDFNYLEPRDVSDRARIDRTGLHIAGMHYGILLLEKEPEKQILEALAPMEAEGRLVRYPLNTSPEDLMDRIGWLDPPRHGIRPHHPGLRVRHVQKTGIDWFLLFQETSTAVEVQFDPQVPGDVFELDLFGGDLHEKRRKSPARLEGHQMRVFGVREGSTQAKDPEPDAS